MDISLTERLSYKYARSAGLTAIALGVFITCFFIFLDYQWSGNHVFQQARAILSAGSKTSEIIIHQQDLPLAQRLVDGLTDYPAVVSAVMVNHEGKIIARSRHSAIITPYRWLSDWLFGKNASLRQDLYAPGSDEVFLGYLLVEIDTFVIGKSFLQRASLIGLCGLCITLILTALCIWLNQKMLAKPFHETFSALTEIDPHNPLDLRLRCPVAHSRDEIGLLVTIVNKLIDNIESNLSRRARAESDLRKNLSSIEHIVAERTDVLRSTNKRLQAMLAESGQALKSSQKLAELRSDLLTIMTHEFTTVFDGIAGLLACPDAFSDESAIETALQAGQYLKRLLGDIANDQSIVLKQAAFDPGEVIEQTASLFAEAAYQQSLEIHIFVDPELPEQVSGDPFRVRQIIHSLIQCLIKFSESGLLEISIKPDHKHPDLLLVTLWDSGISITTDAFKALFQPLPDEPGTEDWGLSVSHRLIKMMSGEVTLSTERENSVGFKIALPLPASGPPGAWRNALQDFNILLIWSGSLHKLNLVKSYLESWGAHLTLQTLQSDKEFTLRLKKQDLSLYHACLTDNAQIASRYTPAKRAQSASKSFVFCDPRKPVQRKTLLASLLCAMPVEAPPLKGIRVLLAEDRPFDQWIVRHLLKRLHCSVDCVNNGLEAIERLSESAYDLLLMDSEMPDMDGYEATRLIRESKSTERLPIIGLSSDEKQCLASGMNACIAKPFDLQALLVLLRRWVH